MFKPLAPLAIPSCATMNIESNPIILIERRAMATKDSTSENPDSECSSFLIASPRADNASGGSNDLHTLILKITGGPEGVRQISGTVQGDPRLLHVHDHLYRLPLPHRQASRVLEITDYFGCSRVQEDSIRHRLQLAPKEQRQRGHDCERYRQFGHRHSAVVSELHIPCHHRRTSPCC